MLWQKIFCDFCDFYNLLLRPRIFSGSSSQVTGFFYITHSCKQYTKFLHPDHQSFICYSHKNQGTWVNCLILSCKYGVLRNFCRRQKSSILWFAQYLWWWIAAKYTKSGYNLVPRSTTLCCVLTNISSPIIAGFARCTCENGSWNTNQHSFYWQKTHDCSYTLVTFCSKHIKNHAGQTI